MRDEMIGFMQGMAAALIILVMLFFVAKERNELINEKVQLITECEKELPRTQICILTAIKDNK